MDIFDLKFVKFARTIITNFLSINLYISVRVGVADARVDVWDSSREDGGWSPVFLRPFNDWEVEEVERFLHFLHNKKIRQFQEDRLVLKETMTDGFSVRHIYRKLMHSLPMDFPCRSIWNPIVPPKLCFFSLGSFLGQGAYS